MRPLTKEECDLVRHICEHGWNDPEEVVDREKLLAQLDYLMTRRGCDVEDCPCIEFSYKGTVVWEFEGEFPTSERATDVGRVTLVMDIKDSPLRATSFQSMLAIL